MVMTSDMFNTVLAKAEATTAKRGPATLPDGKTLTLYVANNGASMSVGNLIATRLVGDVVEARNKKGELYLFALVDVYAASIRSEGDGDASRKAGFVG